MSDAAPKRFYKTVTVRPEAGGHAVFLDERRLKTPARADFIAPTAALAAAIAAEWEAQGEKIDLRSMTLTALSNAAIDRVAPEREAFGERLAAYGTHDLLCYRAEAPVELVARQAKAWQPILDWFAERHGAALALAEGVIHVDQPPEALAAQRAAVLAHDAFRLAGLQILVTATGSLTLGLAVAARRIEVEEALALARLDEDFQNERWGKDDEAEARAAAIAAEARNAARFIALLD